MAQREPFIAAESGADADPFMLHIYAALNARGIRSLRGGEWHATTVRTMEGYGLVRLERGERGRITPKLMHDRVELDLPLGQSAPLALDSGYQNRFFAKALPEPDLKYCSSFLAVVSSITAT